MESNKFPNALREGIRSKLLDEYKRQVAKCDPRSGGHAYIDLSVTFNLQTQRVEASGIEIIELPVPSRKGLKSTDPIWLGVNSHFDTIFEVHYFLDEKNFSSYKLSPPHRTLAADVKKRNVVATSLRFEILEK